MSNHDHWHVNNWKECIYCKSGTGYDDCICSVCRDVVPTHIPYAQTKRYLERIKDESR